MIQDHGVAQSILEVIQARAEQQPDRTAFIALEHGEREIDRVSFSELDLRARSVAAQLQASSKFGERVLLLYPSGIDFIASFLGCLYAGAVAVPAYPPLKNRFADRLHSIVQDCRPSTILVDNATLHSMERRSNDLSAVGQIPVVAIDRNSPQSAAGWVRPAVDGGTLAFLQYTSGSTGIPKGVMVSHGNILANVRQIASCVAAGEDLVSVSWLPLFHDMGLLGTVLLPLFAGGQTVLMDPAAFMQRPARWLHAITQFGGTACAAPDSAYLLCAQKVSAEEKRHLDLSSWSAALSGSEPVRASTIERFTREFSSCGFNARAMRPVYGMAEATLFITGQPKDTYPLLQRFNTDQLSHGIAVESADAGAQQLVSCGSTWGEHALKIVDFETRTLCRAGEVGEIWFAGPSVGKGYWRREEESKEVFSAHIEGGHSGENVYLRTGDLGFLNGDDLFITGRLKDLIIVAGRNLYPQDLERTAEDADPALASHAAAAFSVEEDGEERIVVAIEVRREAKRSLDSEATASAIRRALSEEHGASLHAVVFLRPASILRTSSGKVQRRQVRAAYLQGVGLEIIAKWQKLSTVVPEVSSRSERSNLEMWLAARISRLAGIPVRELDPWQPFSTYGLNSSDAITLAGELEEHLGRPFMPTLLYDYPSIALLAQRLNEQPVDETRAMHGSENEPIAIIGMGCRFPGANNPEAFWQLLKNGQDAVAASPRRVMGLPPTGMLEEVDRFDAELFGINAREAEMMDPQQRLLLEVAWEAIEDSGIAPSSLAGSRTAVMVGISGSDYARLIWQASADISPYATTGNALSIAANRISYAFDLRGPSWSVDTACSSSLVALHQACQALRRGECDTALVGGANLILVPQLSAAFTQAGMLSPDGVCRAFDEKANGYVRGEGVGVVFLKRLSEAIRAGDRIQAVVRGVAVNQDGRSNGLTAPNGPAQQAVIREALREAGVKACDVGMVEAHGTGTRLGDPIELNSLIEVLEENRTQDDLCWLGSVKTNIGHLEAAAGIAGLIKATLALRHQEVPPHLHFTSMNPYIAIADKPFHVPQDVMRWKAGTAGRIAGISSFGFGGTNAHAILAEGPVRSERAVVQQHRANLLAFAARTPEALGKIADSYAEFLKKHPETQLEDFAYTVNRSRSFLAHRQVIIFSSREELLTKLAHREKPRATSVRRRIVFHFCGEYGVGETALELATMLPAFRRLLGSEPGELETRAISVSDFQSVLAQLWVRFGVRPQAISWEGIGKEAALVFATSLDESVLFLESSEMCQEADWVLPISPSAACWTSILDQLADFYLNGGNVDWAVLTSNIQPQRLGLPTYPFERNSYWIEAFTQEHSLPGNVKADEHSDAVLYRRHWELLKSTPGLWSASVGHWLILADRGGVGAQLAMELSRKGNTCSLISEVEVEKLSLHDQPLQGVVHLGSLDLEPTDMAGRSKVSSSVLALVRMLKGNLASGSKTHLWLVTAGAMPVLEQDVPAVSQAALWGLGQAIEAEHPELWGGLLDVDPARPSACLLDAIEGRFGEARLALRDGQRYAAKILHDHQPMESNLPPCFEENATYLITGGVGGLGTRLTKWLLERGAGNVALLGRTVPQQSVNEKTRFFRCDLANTDETMAVVREIENSMPPLKGIFHLAGTLDDGLLLAQNGERFYRSGAGKAEGAWNLHLASRDIALDYFVLFSSMASLVTLPGQGSYAAANFVLDTLAHHRRATGKPALSVNWGPWADLGMAATEYGRAAVERMSSFSVAALPADVALTMLGQLMSSGAIQIGVTQLASAKLSRKSVSAITSSQLAGFPIERHEGLDRDTEFVIALRSCASVDRFDWLAARLLEIFSETLRLTNVEAITSTQSFLEMGGDSILALELTNRLSSTLGRTLPGTLLFTFPTIAALTDHLLRELTMDLGTADIEEDSRDLNEEELTELIAKEIGGK
ncbi:SDR family NAD(P)-dependent oxidoreductase [Granulicella mallensis]|uniref:Acyl transferase domain-containing protein/acyl-CoA synthetase (AMP-forming)/AMP-acid ligase II/acyl carrier protein n=1 Tax=Granulicella mallensis TaxID=940614 RepID=A0A7W7ZUK9_9BACT|nr:SDR family NAD(P)-dependent oxidoreductase [Granulicella mallensis]MBB5066042.1 acyl transferase domain-containing protein/acyl-CoA synthetase (AMP-forming)/AMP-acid ligase II/acyl carrier protein [Granulicella mallensis]